MARIYVTLMNIKLSLLCAFICLLACPQSAQAYLDAGTGSYVFQVVLASILVATYSVRSFLKAIVVHLMKIAAKVIGSK